MVEALVYGLGGGKKEKEDYNSNIQSIRQIDEGFDFRQLKPPAASGESSISEGEEPITVQHLSQLNRDSGGAFPVRMHDEGLPPAGVITLDFEEMKRRNAERVAAKHRKVG